MISASRKPFSIDLSRLHDSATSFENEWRMLIGYARVSTQDQNLNLQREPLKQAG